MIYEIKLLNEDLIEDYQFFLDNAINSMFYHTVGFKNILESVLKSAIPEYFLLLRDDKIIAALPSFVISGKYGKVINSLPFYGSHGSLIKLTDTDAEECKKLISYFHKKRSDNAIVSTTIISNLKEDFLPSNSQDDLFHTDVRNAQILDIQAPNQNSTLEEIQQKLLRNMNSKTRNLVRKGLSQEFNICRGGSLADLELLSKLHTDQCIEKGIKPKHWDFFASVYANLEFPIEFCVYLAKTQSNEIAAALLVFYYKNWVEYYVPVINPIYRSSQPLSAIIFTAMSDASFKLQAKYWNWGGTLSDQSTLYNFKSKWGSLNYAYEYRTYVKNPDNFMRLSEIQILENYSNFYVFPFEKLRKND